MNLSIKTKILLVLLFLLAIFSMLLLILYALKSNMSFFYTPSELVHHLDRQSINSGQYLRLGGMVQAGSVARDPESLQVSFRVYDAVTSILVNYEGMLPNLFREEQGVVIHGVVTEGGGVRAIEVLAKHDENYLPVEIRDAMAEHHKPKLILSNENSSD